MKSNSRRLTAVVCVLCALCMLGCMLGAAANADPQTETRLSSRQDSQPPRLLPKSAPVERSEARELTVNYTLLPLAQVRYDEPKLPPEDTAETALPAHRTANPSVTNLPTPREEYEPSPDGKPVVAKPNGQAIVPDDLELVDTFIATAYTVTGVTSTGTYTTVNRTLAVNPNVIPYGSHVWLFLDDGTLVGDFYAEDTGSNMLANPYVVDIYMGENTYNQCILWGAQHVTIYIQPEAE